MAATWSKISLLLGQHSAKTDSFYQIYGSNMVENLFAAKSALCKNDDSYARVKGKSLSRIAGNPAPISS
jgi:hypothetical protein